MDKIVKNEIVDHIKKQHTIHDDLYILIRLYQKTIDNNATYDMKELKNGGIKINIDKLPIPLQHIIHGYIKLNKQKTS
tara:strand:- start:125 stop:358 length:234 start_codon:yes stop_codon:yes gene_type:complete